MRGCPNTRSRLGSQGSGVTNQRRRCAGTNARGESCQSPMVGEDGYCTAHRDGGSATMAERGRKGAESLKKHWRGQVLDETDLPPLRTPFDAEQWLEVVGRAVATGRPCCRSLGDDPLRQRPDMRKPPTDGGYATSGRPVSNRRPSAWEDSAAPRWATVSHENRADPPS